MIRLWLLLGWRLGEGADVIDQVPVFFGLEAGAFGGHILMAVFDDVEDLAVGTVFESGGIGEVGDLQLHVGGEVAFAVAGLAVAHGAVDAPPLFGAGERFGRGLDGIGLLGGFGGDGRGRRGRYFLRGWGPVWSKPMPS